MAIEINKNSLDYNKNLEDKIKSRIRSMKDLVKQCEIYYGKDSIAFQNILEEYEQARAVFFDAKRDNGKITKDEIKKLTKELDDVANAINLEKKNDDSKKRSNKIAKLLKKDFRTYSFDESLEALSYLNKIYNSRDEADLGDKLKTSIFFQQESIANLDNKRDIRLFQEKLIKKILGTNHKGFNKDGLLLAYHSTKGNYITNVENVEKRINSNGLQNVGNMAISNYLAYLHKTGNFTKKYINAKLTKNNIDSLVSFYKKHKNDNSDDFKFLPNILESKLTSLYTNIVIAIKNNTIFKEDDKNKIIVNNTNKTIDNTKHSNTIPAKQIDKNNETKGEDSEKKGKDKLNKNKPEKNNEKESDGISYTTIKDKSSNKPLVYNGSVGKTKVSIDVSELKGDEILELEDLRENNKHKEYKNRVRKLIAFKSFLEETGLGFMWQYRDKLKNKLSEENNFYDYKDGLSEKEQLELLNFVSSNIGLNKKESLANIKRDFTEIKTKKIFNGKAYRDFDDDKVFKQIFRDKNLISKGTENIKDSIWL